MFIRARKRPVVSGAEGMIGQQAEAMDDFSGPGPFRGGVFIEGEHWQAESLAPVIKGKRVRVLAMRGLVLDVEPETDSVMRKN
jgi:membrane-bound serine protease (ClpP class)